MTFWFFIQLLIVGIFFFMFLRGSKVVWGIGLLTVVSAVLFNTVLSIFGREQTAQDMGLWVQVLNGLHVGGAAIWLWGVVRPLIEGETPPPDREEFDLEDFKALAGEKLSRRAVSMTREASGYDLKLLREQINQNLGPEDVYDLIFDLDLVENLFVVPEAPMTATITNILEWAERRGTVGDLGLAVERILTPVPADHFPRVENLRADTPPTILRRYLLTFYDLAKVEQMAEELDVPWELLGIDSKQNKVRQLLLYLKRRNRVQELVDILQRDAASSQPADSTIDTDNKE